MNSAKLFGKSASLKVQFARYVVVGGVAFVVDFAALFALTEYLHIYYLVSSALAFILGSVVNYRMAIAWVFHHRALDNKTAELAAYVAIGVMGLLLNTVLLWFFTEVAGLLYLYSKAWAAILIFGFNFGVRKLVLFSPRGKLTDLNE